MTTTHEYTIFGIIGPDAADASNLADAAVRFEDHARDILADLLESHGETIAARRMRDRWEFLGIFGEGSLCLAYMDDEGDVWDVLQIGWHNPTAESYQQLADDAWPREEDGSGLDEDYGMVPW